MFKRFFGIATILIAVIAFFVFGNSSAEEQTEPWNQKQLLEPAELAKTLNDPHIPNPVILSLGEGGIIESSKEAGETGSAEGLRSFEAEIDQLPKNTDIVIYCGCCPFENCPNVRPAFRLLNEMGFENHKLLNLRDNIKVDWIDKGFPLRNQE